LLGTGLGLTHRISSPLSAAEATLLEAIGMSAKGCRVLVRRPLTVALGRHAYLPGAVVALLTFAISYGHGGAAVLAAAIAALVMTLSLAAHEGGHVLLGRHAEGVTPRMIDLGSTGGVSVVEGRYENARGAALFAAGGPLATAIVTGALVVGGLQLPGPFGAALILSAVLNGLLLGAYLLPVAPTDGYLLVRSAVWAEVGSRAEAERRALGWSRALLGWAVFCSLVVLDRNPIDGLLALFLVGTFALQHHAVASRSGPSGVRAERRSPGLPRR
jgi:Zn-dependent protease